VDVETTVRIRPGPLIGPTEVSMFQLAKRGSTGPSIRSVPYNPAREKPTSGKFTFKNSQKKLVRVKILKLPTPSIEIVTLERLKKKLTKSNDMGSITCGVYCECPITELCGTDYAAAHSTVSEGN
jgi:hypothetical protein